MQLGVRLQLPRNRALYERLGYHFVEARTHAGYAEPTYAILEKVLVTANHTSIPPLDDRR